jgi:hypothetical protein
VISKSPAINFTCAATVAPLLPLLPSPAVDPCRTSSAQIKDHDSLQSLLVRSNWAFTTSSPPHRAQHTSSPSCAFITAGVALESQTLSLPLQPQPRVPLHFFPRSEHSLSPFYYFYFDLCFISLIQ